ncbi:hypothetical protein M569_16781 [Genlisea aurea]|uniref:SPX domain-containing protein n=1 Tax=Genlisea aurea TaxID=192259 RepID=S8BTW8_9LAMI|nr:hypothetical protein M569_16781 [Genlisea aurea]
MKFGKRLKGQMEESLPEWRDKFLSYKNLKRLLRADVVVDEAEFAESLDVEIEKFNAFFTEREEDFVIRRKELNRRIDEVIVKGRREEMGEIGKDMVNFHGEMVLLLNYTNINYTGLGKIVKKYDKRSGGNLRARLMEKVAEQPFFATDLVAELAKECEATIDGVLLPHCAILGGVVGGGGIFKNAVAALLTMEEIRRESSTYGRYSLPPLDLPDFDLIRSLRTDSPVR